MEMQIKSRKLDKTFSFWMQDVEPGESAYVYRTFLGRPGTLGEQLTRPGGSTIRATPETFEQTCRLWYNRYIQEQEPLYSAGLE